MRAMFRFRRILVLLLAGVAAAAGWGESAAAITVRIDYSTDTSSFLAAGSQGRAAMNAAAAFYSDLLDDTFAAIATPPKFYGSLGGEATWYSKRKFTHPTTGVTDALLNVSFPANEFVVFVGARDLAGNDLGRGGPGSSATSFVRNGNFTMDELTQVNEMNDQFTSAVTRRGETSGFGRWGGAIAFDSPTNWHFDHTTNPTGGQIDFFSVALHELAHAIGLGASEEWNALVDGTSFIGARAVDEYVPAGNVPLASADDTAHWLQAITNSTVYNSGVSQLPLMVPSLASNTRRLLTDLDVAALQDLGWEIDLPAAAAASFASNAELDGSSGFAALSASVVPEPAAMVLVVIGAMFATVVRSRVRG